MRAVVKGNLGAAALILLGFGCSDPAGGEPESPLGPTETASGSDGGASRSRGSAKDSEGAVEPWNGEPATLDVAMTECAPLIFDSCQAVYPSGAISALGRLQRLGSRWLAEGVWDSGFVVFDADGGDASEGFVRTGSLDRAAASSDDFHVASIDDGKVVHRRYDTAGNALGVPVLLAEETPDEIALGRVGDGSLVVWSTPTHVVARGVTGAGPADDVFHLETDVWKDGFRAALASRDESEIAIAWSDRRVADSHHRVFFVRADTAGARGLPRTLIDSLAPHRVVDLERTDAGYALVVAEGDRALVVPLSEWGDQVGPTYRFFGISRVYGLAVHASGEMLLAALRSDGRDAVLRLDPNGAPRGKWMCLDPSPSDKEHSVGLASTDEGYAVLFRSPSEQELLYYLSAPRP